MVIGYACYSVGAQPVGCMLQICSARARCMRPAQARLNPNPLAGHEKGKIMKPEELITFRTFSNLIEAEIAASHLKSQNIEVMVKKDDSGGMRPHFQLTQGVDLIVRKKDLDRAKEILAAKKV
jgi:hypothetical protein